MKCRLFIAVGLAISTLCVTVLSEPTSRGGAHVPNIPDRGNVTYHAVIVGIDNYQHWGRLRRPVEDSLSLADILKNRYGFDSVTTLLNTNATRKAMLATLEKLLTLKDDSAVLIFFSGHGTYNESLSEGYWIPVEAHRDAPDEYLENVVVKKYVSRMKARHVLVVSDSCFSGTLLRGDDKKQVDTPDAEYYRRANGRPSRMVITSGDVETVPDEGAFAVKFLNALIYPPTNGIVVAGDVGTMLEKEVPRFSSQTPRCGRLSGDPNDEGGQFLFIRSFKNTDVTLKVNSVPRPLPEPVEQKFPNKPVFPELEVRITPTATAGAPHWPALRAIGALPPKCSFELGSGKLSELSTGVMQVLAGKRWGETVEIVYIAGGGRISQQVKLELHGQSDGPVDIAGLPKNQAGKMLRDWKPYLTEDLYRKYERRLSLLGITTLKDLNEEKVAKESTQGFFVSQLRKDLAIDGYFSGALTLEDVAAKLASVGCVPDGGWYLDQELTLADLKSIYKRMVGKDPKNELSASDLVSRIFTACQKGYSSRRP